MRLKKGSKVEVLSKEEVATGAWRCAEIISGNGRTYTVKYGWFPITTAAILEKVPRTAIRPCPPPVEGFDYWVPGDLVEVFHNLSWKTATVTKVMDGNYFLVRLLGLTKGFQVHKSHLRVRQSWENGTWFVVGEGSGNCAMPTEHRQSHTSTKLYVKDYHCNTEEDDELWNTFTVSNRKMKRSPFGSSYVESCNAVARKVRVVERDGSRQRIFLENASPEFEKVDAFIFPQELMGEECVHSFYNNGRNELYRGEVGRGDNSFIAGTSISDDTESCASSVGSCSANNNVIRDFPFCFTKHHREDTESLCSDAESFCGRGCEEEECLLPINEKFVGNGAESFCGRGYEEEDYPLSTNNKLVAGVHRSELLAYRCAIEALYASGPLTWDEELKMSNLRHSLRISDDEHLRELKNLIAT